MKIEDAARTDRSSRGGTTPSRSSLLPALVIPSSLFSCRPARWSSVLLQVCPEPVGLALVKLKHRGDFACQRWPLLRGVLVRVVVTPSYRIWRSDDSSATASASASSLPVQPIVLAHSRGERANAKNINSGRGLLVRGRPHPCARSWKLRARGPWSPAPPLSCIHHPWTFIGDNCVLLD